MRSRNLITLVFSLFITVCSYSQNTEVVFIQMNDVYEIAPLEGGMYGGLARVASLIKDYKYKYEHCYSVLSGDFISPSAIGTSEFEGKMINGKHMVDVLNTCGLDYVTFGNHEFDVKYDVLQQRIDESAFQWISGNVKHKAGDAVWKFGKKSREDFAGFPEYIILRIPGITGHEIRIGIIAVTISSNKVPYVLYEDPVASAKRVYGTIKDSIDCLIAVTHLAFEDDSELARQLPEISLIMGGHEHVNMLEKVGSTVIAKADANARTVYFHKLVFDASGILTGGRSELIEVNDSIPEDPETKLVVNKWISLAYDGFRKKGFEPEEKVAKVRIPLDGREISIRYQQTNLGKLIAESMLKTYRGAQLAILNSGSVRLDDMLSGEITQYDIIRTLPFGGKILTVEMKGSLLEQVLNAGMNNKGSGGYLQTANVEFDSLMNAWLVGGIKIFPDRVYYVAAADYLMTGMEQNMEFLNKNNPGIVKITEPDPSNTDDLRNDIRFAVIDYLRRR